MRRFGSSTIPEIESTLKKEITAFLRKQSTQKIDKELISDINQLISHYFKYSLSPEDNHRLVAMELRKKVIDLILLNTYDMTEEQVSRGLDSVAESCYIFPHTDEIYFNTGIENVLIPFSQEYFADFFITKTEKFQKEKIFQAFLQYMKHIYKHNLKTAVIRRLVHLRYPLPFFPFVRHNKSLFLNKDFPYGNSVNNYVLLTHEVLSTFMQEVLKLNYDRRTISLLLQEFWNCPDFVDEAPSPSLDIISLPSNKSAKLSRENGILELNFATNTTQQIPGQNQFRFMKFLHQFPRDFIEGSYPFSSCDKAALHLLLGNSADNLSHFSSLLAASYVSGKHINYPIVFFSNGKNDLRNIKSVISSLFDNKISYLSAVEVSNPEENINNLSQKLYSENAVALLETDDEDLDVENLEKFTKRFIIRNGPVAIKNPLPVIIITSSIDLCQNLNRKLDVKVIEVPTIDCNIDLLSSQIDYGRIRQSLLLYGFSNFSKRITNLKKWAYKETLLENFYHDFIEVSEDKYVAKETLKNEFMNYAQKFDKSLDIKPIAICKYLIGKGFDGKKKKRIKPNPNPVAVIMGIELNLPELIKSEVKDDITLVINNPEFIRVIELLENQNIAVQLSLLK